MTEPSTYSTMEWMMDCGMHDHLHLLGRHVEEPAGLDDLETLVHQGGGVDGDLGAIFHVG